MSWEAWGDDDAGDYDHLLESGWLTSEQAEDLRKEVASLKAEREKLYHLAWKWGFDREEGTYHPDDPPACYGEWVHSLIRRAAGIDEAA